MSTTRTPAEHTTEVFIDAIVGDDHYPAGAVFIDATLDDFGRVLYAAVREDRPVVIVLPTCEEIVLEPKAGVARRLLRRALVLRWRRALDAMGPLVDPAGEDFDFPLESRVSAGYTSRLHGRMPAHAA